MEFVCVDKGLVAGYLKLFGVTPSQGPMKDQTAWANKLGPGFKWRDIFETTPLRPVTNMGKFMAKIKVKTRAGHCYSDGFVCSPYVSPQVQYLLKWRFLLIWYN